MTSYNNMGLLCAIICNFSISDAATLNVMSDFEIGGKDGWQHPQSSPNQTSIILDAPDNSMLSVTASGGSGVGSRLLAPNTTADWIGDYTGVGITQINMDLNNNSSTVLSIRIGLDGAGGRWVTAPIPLLPSEDGSFSFGITAGSLTAAGGTNAALTLSSVSQIRILHNASVDYKGASVNASFLVDNITLVPEPSSSALLGLGLFTLIISRRRF